MPTLKVEEDLQFSTNVKIRALEENEFDRFFVTSEIFRRLFAVRFKGTRLFVIDCDTTTNKPLDQMKISAQTKIQEYIHVDVAAGRKMTNDVRSVLHIFKSGALKAEFMLVDVAKGWGDLSTFSLEDVDQVSDPYEIERQEVKAIQDLWEVYGKRNWVKHKFLQVAIDRLNYGSTRARPEDSIIDYVVSLEALLLHDLQTGDRGELRNRFALRAPDCSRAMLTRENAYLRT